MVPFVSICVVLKSVQRYVNKWPGILKSLRYGYKRWACKSKINTLQSSSIILTSRGNFKSSNAEEMLKFYFDVFDRCLRETKNEEKSTYRPGR